LTKTSKKGEGKRERKVNLGVKELVSSKERGPPITSDSALAVERGDITACHEGRRGETF